MILPPHATCLALMAGLTLSSCVATRPELPATVPPDGGMAALLSVRAVGGLCPTGECEQTTTIRHDGTFTAARDGGTVRTGTVTRHSVETLAREVASADFKSIRAVKFTGTCPTAYDGQELIYTFDAPSGPEEIASCKVRIDSASPLFEAVESVLKQTAPR